ncbi:MAG: methyltransferase domain-containing protein [Peptococcaceae bacterium]|jgi:SAM-dependent methyltransferase|nr:methyltransferase domain-containing protein [Peptococcaceae bacterium]
MYQREALLAALIVLGILLLQNAGKFIRRGGPSALFSVGVAGRTGRLVDRLLAQHRLLPGAYVLLVGPDPGLFSLGVARLIAPGWLTCLDAEPPRLKTIKEAARENGVKNIVTLAGDATHMPFSANRFDQVVLINSLGQTGDQEAALAEIARVLKDNGRLTISDSFLAPGYQAVRRVVRLAAPLGFSVTRRTNNLFFYTLEMVKPLKAAGPAPVQARSGRLAWTEQPEQLHG